MNANELKRIQRELGLTLPANYVKVMLKFDKALLDWPQPDQPPRHEIFFSDAGQIIDVNQRIRTNPQEFVKSPKEFRSSWPGQLLVIGRVKDNWKVIETTQQVARIISIIEGELLPLTADLKISYDNWKWSHKQAWKAAAKAAKPPPVPKTPKPKRTIGPMTDAEFSRIEEELQLKLPSAYRKIMRGFPDELHEWPPAPGSAENERISDFLFDVGEIVKANKVVRKQLRKNFPSHGFVIGRADKHHWLMNLASANPPVQLAHNGGFLLGGFANLPAFYENVLSNHQHEWAAAKKRSKLGPVATPDLVEIGKSLSRPAVVLTKKGKDYAAIWRGQGVVPGPDGEWGHLISVACDKLPVNPRKLKGVLSVYESTDPDNFRCEHLVKHDPQARLPAKTDGMKLYGTPFDCPPEPNYLLEEGPPVVKRWTESRPKEYEDTVQAYVNFFCRSYPPNGHAMLGGWTDPLGNHLEKWMKNLLVMTIEDAEPYVEVWDDGKGLRAYGRIS